MRESPSLDLERLFHDHQRELLAMLRRMVGCQDTAADLAQEAYARLAHMPSSQPIVSPRAFLFRIATNLALDHFRKQRFRAQRQTPLEEAEEVPSGAPALDSQVYDRQLLATLEKILARLSHRTRTVFILRRVDGYSYQEIAERMGMSQRAVEKHLVKAMTRCQEELLDAEVSISAPRGETGGQEENQVG